jgi:hypothetical protein
MKVPQFKEPGLTDFLTKSQTESSRVQNGFMTKATANNSVLLYSPSMKVYEVKVSDAGVLSATLVAG